MRSIKLLNLYFPLVLLLLACAVVAFDFEYTKKELFVMSFIVNFIFLNTIHIVFTFIMILALPELRRWWEKNYSLFKEKTKIVVLFFIVGAFSLLTSIYNNSDSAIAVILFSLYLTIPLHHPVMQHYGLLMVNNNDGRREISTNIKKYFYIFHVFNFAYILIVQLKSKSLIGDVTFSNVRQAIFILFIFLIMMTMLVMGRYVGEKGRRANNVVFLARLLLYPIGYYSSTAYIFIACVHGVEYLESFIRMTSNSNPKWTQRIKVSAALMTVLVVCLGVVSRRGGLLEIVSIYSKDSFKIEFLWAILSGITYLHYYLDNRLFAFKEEFNKHNHSHLLMER